MRFLLLTALIAIASSVTAQCPTCTPDPACVSGDGMPMICPLELPAATAGVYYEQALTFYLPAEVNDPESGLTATLLEITITSVTGLPFGMEYSINDPDATYYPSQGENLGCATICGTPVLPGVYDMVITINALAEAFGFEVTQVQTFTYTLVVNEGEGGTSTFSYDNIAGCGSLEVTAEATIGGTSAQLTTYTWDFGNGQGSDQASPGTITYDSPGEYTISLNTVIYNYVLNTVSVSNLNNNWDGDADDFFGSADPYFELVDGNGNVVYTSGILDNTTSGTWDGLSIILSTPPYSLIFWDDDLVTQIDNLGTASISLTNGTIAINTGNGTVGEATLSLGEVNNITSEAVVNVFPIPDPAFSEQDGMLQCADQSLSTYIWTLNEIMIPGENAPQITLTDGGWYNVTVTNSFGCQATGTPFLYCPPVTPTYDTEGDLLFVPDGYTSYEWYYNGLPLEGISDNEIYDPLNGNYSVVVTTWYGCTITSEVITVSVGVEEMTGDFLHVYPNPFDSEVRVEIDGEPGDYSLYDQTGRIVRQGRLSAHSCSLWLGDLDQGAYILEWRSDRHFERVRLVRR